MKKSVPIFTFDIPISRDVDELKVIDLRMLNEAKDFTRRKKRRKKRRTVVDEDDNSADDDNGEDKAEDQFLDDDQFTMIDDEFRGAEEYNTHMGRLGSVIRNIEMRERRIRTSLLRKTGREIEREEQIAKEESRKRRLKRKKKKKKKKSGSESAALSPVGAKKKDQNEYDLDDNFIDDDIYGGYVRMGGSSEEEDDDSIDMGGWIQDDEENELGYPYTAPEKRRMSGGKGLSSPFQVPPSPLRPGRTEKKRKRGEYGNFKQPDFVQSLTTLENKLETLKSGNMKRSNFKWDDIADELYQVAVVRGKYYKKIPKKLTEVLVTFPILCEFTEGTIRKNLRDLHSVHVVTELNENVQENTANLKRLILEQFHHRLSQDMTLGPVPNPSDPTFLSLVREKNMKVQWNNQMNLLFYLIITKLREAVEKTNSLKKKKGKYSLKKRVLVDEVHNKYGEIKLVMPNDKDLSFVQKYKELDEYFQQNPGLLPSENPKKSSRKGRVRKSSQSQLVKNKNTTVVPPPSTNPTNLSPLVLQPQATTPQLPMPQIPILNIPIPNLVGGYNPARPQFNPTTQYLMAAFNRTLPNIVSTTPTSQTVTPIATTAAPIILQQQQQLQQQLQNVTASPPTISSLQQLGKPNTPPTSLHMMGLRKRPEKAFVGELSPSASKRDGDLLLDDEDDDEDEKDDEEELKTPQKRRKSSTATITSAEESSTSSSEKKRKDDEVLPPPSVDPSNPQDNITGKKRKERTSEDQEEKIEGESEKKKRKIELTVIE